jgi:hypothetical protein
MPGVLLGSWRRSPLVLAGFPAAVGYTEACHAGRHLVVIFRNVSFDRTSGPIRTPPI